jgi:hypothetical protein
LDNQLLQVGDLLGGLELAGLRQVGELPSEGFVFVGLLLDFAEQGDAVAVGGDDFVVQLFYLVGERAHVRC